MKTKQKKLTPLAISLLLHILIISALAITYQKKLTHSNPPHQPTIINVTLWQPQPTTTEPPTTQPPQQPPQEEPVQEEPPQEEPIPEEPIPEESIPEEPIQEEPIEKPIKEEITQKPLPPEKPPETKPAPTKETKPKPPQPKPQTPPKITPTQPSNNAAKDIPHPPTTSNQPIATPPQANPPITPPTPTITDFHQSMITQKTDPLYPRSSRTKGEQGTVILLVTLKNGQITTIQTEKSSGYPTLDNSAINAIKKWKFNKTLNETLRIPINFKLTN